MQDFPPLDPPDYLKAFVVDFARLPAGDPRADAAATKACYDAALSAFSEVASDADKEETHRIESDWIASAKEVGVKLPYATMAERFSGKFPSFIQEESDVIRYFSLKEKTPQDDPPILIATIGKPAAGKSKILKEIASGNFVFSDPDENVLENLGPNLYLRNLARTSHRYTAKPLAEDATLEDAINYRNEWRLPSYELFRSASNAINTQVTYEAIEKRLNIAFGWTGIRGYGLEVLVKKGYVAAGYNIRFSVVFASYEDCAYFETLRNRPAGTTLYEKVIEPYLALRETMKVANRMYFYLNERGKEPARALTLIRGTSALKMGHMDSITYGKLLVTANNEALRLDMLGKKNEAAELRDIFQPHELGGVRLVKTLRRDGPNKKAHL